MSALSAGLILLVLLSVRRSHIRVEYSVSWLSAAVVLFIVSLNRTFLTELSNWLGITYAPLALVIVVLSVFLMVFFRFSVIISDLRDNNIALAQRVAILEFRLQSMNETRDTPPSQR
jgi:hypothetical protein